MPQFKKLSTTSLWKKAAAAHDRGNMARYNLIMAEIVSRG